MLNLEKCTFEVKVEKLRDFFLTERGIEENPNKCEAIKLTTKKEGHETERNVNSVEHIHFKVSTICPLTSC